MLPEPASFHIRAYSRGVYILQFIAPPVLAWPVAALLPLDPGCAVLSYCLLAIAFIPLLSLLKYYRVHVGVTEQTLTCSPICRLYGRSRTFAWAEVTGFRQVDNDFVVLELWHPRPTVLLAHSKTTTGDDYGRLVGLLSSLPA